jgi:hypothetical protein
MSDEQEPRSRHVELFGANAPRIDGKVLCSRKLITQEALREIANEMFLGAVNATADTIDHMSQFVDGADRKLEVVDVMPDRRERLDNILLQFRDDDDDPLIGRDPVS